MSVNQLRRNPSPTRHDTPPSHLGSSFAPSNENDGEHFQDGDASASVSERSVDLKEDVVISKGDDLQNHPHEGINRVNENVQNLRRSSRPSVFPRNFNDFVVDSKVRYGLEKYVNYSNLSKGNYCFATMLNKGTKPKTYFEASQYIHWVDAMHAKMDALYRNNTWELADLLVRRKSIGSK
ncbi:hypothetical protein Tco_0099006 [Tanacetum coccineum]